MELGLFFICFQRDPAQFIAIQRHLDAQDRLNRYVTHTSSALFAVFPGVRTKHEYIGQALFG